MGKVEFKWHGEEVKRKERAGRNKGLRLAAEHLLASSQAIVPIEEATLERSGVASVDEGKGQAAVSYDTVYLGRPTTRGADLATRSRPPSEVPRTALRVRT